MPEKEEQKEQEEKEEEAQEEQEEEAEEETQEEESEEGRKQDDSTLRELKRTRAEAARYRVSLRELEKKVSAFEDEKKQAERAKMEKEERLALELKEKDEQLAALKQRQVESEIGTAIRDVAAGLGFANPKDAARLIDREGIVVSESGSIDKEQVKDLVQGLAEESPYLLKGQASQEERETKDLEGFGHIPGANTSKTDSPPSIKGKGAEFRRQAEEQKKIEAARLEGRALDWVKGINQRWEQERAERIENPKGG